jgi:hypothetical protein
MEANGTERTAKNAKRRREVSEEEPELRVVKV